MHSDAILLAMWEDAEQLVGLGQIKAITQQLCQERFGFDSISLLLCQWHYSTFKGYSNLLYFRVILNLLLISPQEVEATGETVQAALWAQQTLLELRRDQFNLLGCYGFEVLDVILKGEMLSKIKI